MGLGGAGEWGSKVTAEQEELVPVTVGGACLPVFQGPKEHGGGLGEGDHTVPQRLCRQPGDALLPLAPVPGLAAARPRPAPHAAQHDEEALPAVSAAGGSLRVVLTPWSLKSIVKGSQEKLSLVTASHGALVEMCYATPSSCHSFAQVTVHRVFCLSLIVVTCRSWRSR